MFPIFIKVHDMNLKTQVRINIDSIEHYNRYSNYGVEGIKACIETACNRFYTKESPKQIDNLIAKAIKEACVTLDD